MEKRLMLFSFLLILIQLQQEFWICVTSRPFDHHHFLAFPPQAALSPQSLQFPFISHQSNKKRVDEVMKEEMRSSYEDNEKMKKIGSRPPSCEHKCFGCSPCQPTQVPTITSHHLHLQYTNYEPESWKCKCGRTFYSP